MPTLKAYVVNFMFIGENFTDKNGQLQMDEIVFECGKFKFTFIQDMKFAKAPAKYRGTVCQTSEVFVHDVKESDLTPVIETLEKLCWLLSFVGLCRVGCAGYEFPVETKKKFISLVAESNFHLPSLSDIGDRSYIRKFVEQVFDRYQGICNTRKLNVVFDYLIHSDRTRQPTEVKLILMFVLLENLKDTFAKEKQIPFTDGAFRKPSKLIKNRMVSVAYSFRELLMMMFAEYQMKPKLQHIVKFRNEMIHSGLSTSNTPAELEVVYAECHDLIREYIFRLLEFKGTFPTYKSRNTEFVVLQ
ncbi:hypothetical protein H8L32_14970 [Undibacterium sp. CY18W]|uniref:Apea-like HEPN domain-containing protein n=1 Tax=Undibacterium hunanense TaxID=2762292 RepID=A0ABR6ZTD3_9BURK|nr:hypothetical protein [Undibacterium hunanense]MBC3918795.1 hypothetical protein [Undibacterium hunanense]